MEREQGTRNISRANPPPPPLSFLPTLVPTNPHHPKKQTEIELTYTLLRIPLHNTKLARLLCILHDEPAQRLFILAVHLASLDKLGAELADAFCIIFRDKVDDNCIDHFRSSLLFLLFSVWMDRARENGCVCRCVCRCKSIRSAGR